MAHTDRSSAREVKRAAFAEALADLAVRDGLDALSLRPAAARLGTSDRMLLYYFGSKAGLVTDVIAIVSARLTAKLAVSPASARLAPAAMMEAAGRLLSDPDVRPFMSLWAEIVARAVRQEDIYVDLGRRITEGWIQWIVTRTSFPPGFDADLGAHAMLSVIEAMSNRRLITDDDVDPAVIVSFLRTLLSNQANTGTIGPPSPRADGVPESQHLSD